MQKRWTIQIHLYYFIRSKLISFIKYFLLLLLDDDAVSGSWLAISLFASTFFRVFFLFFYRIFQYCSPLQPNIITVFLLHQKYKINIYLIVYSISMRSVWFFHCRQMENNALAIRPHSVSWCSIIRCAYVSVAIYDIFIMANLIWRILWWLYSEHCT